MMATVGDTLSLAKTYDICGSKNPELTAVFLHGIAADSTSFDGLIKHLGDNSNLKGVRLVAFDLLGAGKSYSSNELNYDFDEHLEALHNSITLLKIKTPVALVAHSMGALIATRYLSHYPEDAQNLILLSPPVYRAEDIAQPMFAVAMNSFREIVGRTNRDILTAKSFNNELSLIVSDPENYDYFVELKCPTTIIYGELDKVIASFNLPGLLKSNPNLSAIKTGGSHGVTRDKYEVVSDTLLKILQNNKKEAA